MNSVTATICTCSCFDPTIPSLSVQGLTCMATVRLHMLACLPGLLDGRTCLLAMHVCMTCAHIHSQVQMPIRYCVSTALHLVHARLVTRLHAACVLEQAFGDILCEAEAAREENVQIAVFSKLLSPLPASDHELLLLMAAMMRHVEKAGGGGCEADMVHIGRWCTKLLLGALASDPSAEQVVLGILWCLLRTDAMFAAATILRSQRLMRRNSYTQGASEPLFCRKFMSCCACITLCTWQTIASRSQLATV
eukprot:358829-Chlamydomonas_euryale.AAC.7